MLRLLVAVFVLALVGFAQGATATIRSATLSKPQALAAVRSVLRAEAASCGYRVSKITVSPAGEKWRSSAHTSGRTRGTSRWIVINETPVVPVNALARMISAGCPKAPAPRPGGRKLTWAPPELNRPTSVSVPNVGPACASLPDQIPDQPWVCYLAPGRDYVLKLDHRMDDGVGNGGTLAIDGGRNIVIIGGRITPKLDGSSWRGRGFSFENVTGTVHVEGVLIDGGGGATGATDGFLLIATEATFQIQNIRVGVSAPGHNFSGIHPDVIQTASAKEVRIDRLTGVTDLQGLFWNWDLRSGNRQPLAVIAKNVNFAPDSSGRTGAIVFNGSMTSHSCTSCWMRPGASWDNSTQQFKLSEVALYMDSVGTVVRTPWRIVGFDGKVRTAPGFGNLGRRQGDYIEWPGTPKLAGERWYWGSPPGGDFVPAGVAGPDYLSPGYRK